MKVKIKSFNGELPSYLTVGKEYDFDEEINIKDNRSGYIKPDDFDGDEDDHIFIWIDSCEYLNGGSWEVVE